MDLLVVLLALTAGLEAPPPVTQRLSPPASPSPIALVGNREVTQETFEKIMGHRLLALETQLYRAKRQILDGIIASRLLELGAQEVGQSVEQFVTGEATKDVVRVTEEEVRAVYDASRGRFAGPEADALAGIRTSMEQSRLAQARQKLVARLRSKYTVQVLLKPPRVDIATSDAPSQGPADAPVRVVVFADFECPFCSAHSSVLRQLKDRYAEQIRLEYRHFPLPSHKDALLAAQASACMDSQGLFWQMHDLLYANQKQLGREDLFLHVAAAKGDTDAFRACLDGRKSLQRVDVDKKAGDSYGVAATPATFINGRLVPGAAPLAELVTVVEEELAVRAKLAPSR